MCRKCLENLIDKLEAELDSVEQLLVVFSSKGSYNVGFALTCGGRQELRNCIKTAFLFEQGFDESKVRPTQAH